MIVNHINEPDDHVAFLQNITTMTSCGCAHLPEGDTQTRTGQISPGDVFAIRESVYTPIYDILRQNFSNLGRPLWSRSVESYHDILQKDRATEKWGRPCIMMDPEPRYDKTVCIPRRMCIIASFEGKQITDLPEIFQEFCMPLYCDDAPVEGSDHLHSTPGWTKRAWVICWVFHSNRRLISRWGRDPKHPERPTQTWVFGDTAMRLLEEKISEKTVEWQRKCKHQGVGDRLAAECLVS